MPRLEKVPEGRDTTEGGPQSGRRDPEGEKDKATLHDRQCCKYPFPGRENPPRGTPRVSVGLASMSGELVILLFVWLLAHGRLPGPRASQRPAVLEGKRTGWSWAPLGSLSTALLNI